MTNQVYRKRPIAERFWALVEKGDGCWEWRGARKPSGYGSYVDQTSMVRKAWNAHRLAWTLVNGPIPDGMHVCHSCDNPPCCNPAHLFLGTVSDNRLDSQRKGRAPDQAAKWRSRTHCKHGHAFTAENTKIAPKGTLLCRVCARNRTAEYRIRKRQGRG